MATAGPASGGDESPSEYLYSDDLYVDPPPEKFSCPVCLCPVQREPYLTECCGKHFCFACISQVQRGGKPCPTCMASGLKIFPNKERQREINELKVRCPRREREPKCEWNGELGYVEQHLLKKHATVTANGSIGQWMTIWNGHIELVEVRGAYRRTRQIQCLVSTNNRGTIPDIKPDQWPPKMTMNAYPRIIFNHITQLMNFTQPHLVRTVTFNFMENPQTVTILRLLMSTDVPKHFAIVQLPGAGQTCPIRALILVWNEKQNQFTGLIPLQQDKFVAVIKQVFLQRRKPMLHTQTVQPQPLPWPIRGIQTTISHSPLRSGLLHAGPSNTPPVIGTGPSPIQQRSQPCPSMDTPQAQLQPARSDLIQFRTRMPQQMQSFTAPSQGGVAPASSLAFLPIPAAGWNHLQLMQQPQQLIRHQFSLPSPGNHPGMLGQHGQPMSQAGQSQLMGGGMQMGMVRPPPVPWPAFHVSQPEPGSSGLNPLSRQPVPDLYPQIQ